MGHQAALDCGLRHSKGDAIISMDADMQHPPEVIPQIVDTYFQGFDMVYAKRAGRGEQPVMKHMGSRILNRFMNVISDYNIDLNSSIFRIFSLFFRAALSSTIDRSLACRKPASMDRMV
jgi:dolichol-phosphate mannosyltransferase